jgi:hypothetical protein
LVFFVSVFLLGSCSTEQESDNQVGTPSLGSTHFWRANQATTKPIT